MKRGRMKGRKKWREEERERVRKEGREGNREGGKARSLLFLSKRRHQVLNMKIIKNFKQMINTLVPCSRQLCAVGRSCQENEKQNLNPF